VIWDGKIMKLMDPAAIDSAPRRHEVSTAMSNMNQEIVQEKKDRMEG
jgi:hypothetical protein